MHDDNPMKTMLAAIQIPALLFLLPSLSYGIQHLHEPLSASSSCCSLGAGAGVNNVVGCHRRRHHGIRGQFIGFVHQQSSLREGIHTSYNNNFNCRQVTVASLAPDYYESSASNNNKKNKNNNNNNGMSYVPPYGNVRRSPIILNSMSSPSFDSGSSRGTNSPRNRERERRNNNRPPYDDYPPPPPPYPDFYDMDNGLPPPPPPPMSMRRPNEEDDMMFSGQGGNYWVNPQMKMDRYPNNNNNVGVRTRNDPDDFNFQNSRTSTLSAIPPSKNRRMNIVNSRININNDSSSANGSGSGFSMNGGGGNLIDSHSRGDRTSVRDSPNTVDRRNNNNRNGRRMMDGPGAGVLRNDIMGDGGGEWWETRRGEFDPYEEDEFWDEEFGDWDEDGYYREDYGVPPPTRSRSSFRTGAPPPPRPVKDFYDKLFWFGFDPDVTRPTDRTMFGGTRGKFNAMELLRDREDRQLRRDEVIARRSLRGKRVRDDVVQDFGDVEDWNARKTGTGMGRKNNELGGNVMRGGRDDDYGVLSRDERESVRRMREREMMDGRRLPGRGPSSRSWDDYDGYDGFDDYDDYYPEYDVDMRVSRGRDRVRDQVLERRRRSRERSNRLGGDGSRRNRDRRGGIGMFTIPELRRRQEADDYDRMLGLGPALDDDDDDYYDSGRSPSSSRRRKGYAYKYSGDKDDDYDVLDVDRTGSNRSSSRRRSSSIGSPRRRSWEERALEMDRVPPKGATAWGPKGSASGGGMDAQTKAAVDALAEIRKGKRYLEKKENMVLDAEEEVVALKADATVIERKLDTMRDGSKSDKLRMELGYIKRDIEDSSRMLRLARAERDAAQRVVDDIKNKHWALLNEYEASLEFDKERLRKETNIRDAEVYRKDYR